jgi:carbon storage regulator
MLVLSRKAEESVVVGGADGFHRLLKVTVLEIKGGRVRLGFEVDADVPVHRSEVWERIHGNGNGNGRSGSLTECLAAPVACPS